MTDRNIYKDILFGVAVGDALGVPLEFNSRQTIAQKPVTDMTGFGTYNLPAGTFSAGGRCPTPGYCPGDR